MALNEKSKKRDKFSKGNNKKYFKSTLPVEQYVVVLCQPAVVRLPFAAVLEHDPEKINNGKPWHV